MPAKRSRTERQSAPPDPAAALSDIGLTLAQLLDQTDVGLIAKDLDGRYLFVSRGFERITGLAREAVVGRTTEEVYPPEIARQLCKNDADAVAAGRVLELEERVAGPNGVRTVLTHKFPVRGADGTIRAICSAATDITERKRTEEALARAALAVSTAAGDRVFETLVRQLAEILGAGAALITVFFDARRTHMRSLAAWVDGATLPNFEYEVAQSPCAGVIGREFRYAPEGVNPEFAPDTPFREQGFDSYAAYSLSATSGEQLGLIVVMDRKPLAERPLTEAMLKIFAVRAAAEIERARADAALRASEASYRSIFEASEDAIFVHDWDTGAILDVSPKAAELYGHSREALRSLRVGDISADVPPYTEADATRMIQQVKVRAGPVRFEWHARHRDGHLMWNEVTLKRATIAGEPRILAFVRDVTEAKRAAEALRASEEQYRAIFNASADAMVLWNSELRRIDVNPAYESLYGFTRAEVLNSTYPEHLPQDYVERRRELVRRTLAGEPCHVELEARRKSGEPLHVEVRTIPVRHRGEPHVLAIVRDITERKRAEEALRLSEQQYRAMFDASADALVLRDAEFRVVDVNPAYEAMTGYRRDEVLGADYVVANPSNVHQLIRSLHARALAGEAIQLETQLIAKDGRARDLELRGVPIRHQGRPHVLYIGRDITGRKRAEAERLALEGQLRQAQKMEAIGQLTGGIAHDFNNILTSIVGYVTLAAERDAAAGDPKLTGYLEQATRSSRRARDLIQQMLTFSRGQRGERRPVDLKKLVGESARLLHSSMPATLDLQTLNGESVPLASLDPVQAEQILLNLCINARDALQGHGQVRIGVRHARHSAVCASCRGPVEGEWVELTVSDDGPGIAPQVMERMFEPFYSTKEVGKGSGMGLAMVHGIVHDHGGHLLVETAPGRGTTFRVLFPALRAGDAQAEHETLTGFALPPRKLALRGHVLLVDDEEMVRGFMRELLAGWGLEVTEAANGTEACSAFAGAPDRYDLVITDQTMPRLTGMELARQVLALRPGLPVILYSGYADAISDAQVEAAGIRALVRKPVEPAALRGLLESLLPAASRMA